MKKLTLFATCFTLLFFTYSCTSPPEVTALDMDAVKAEISALEANFTKASNAKDVEALLAYYADDAVNMPPGEPIFVGKESIRARMERDMATDSSGNAATMQVVDVWAAGDIAVETGTYSVANTAGEIVNTGKYMSLFEKRDGKYVCIRDIWNSDTKDDDDDDDDDEDE